MYLLLFAIRALVFSPVPTFADTNPASHSATTQSTNAWLQPDDLGTACPIPWLLPHGIGLTARASFNICQRINHFDCLPTHFVLGSHGSWLAHCERLSVIGPNVRLHPIYYGLTFESYHQILSVEVVQPVLPGKPVHRLARASGTQVSRDGGSEVGPQRWYGSLVFGNVDPSLPVALRAVLQGEAAFITIDLYGVGIG